MEIKNVSYEKIKDLKIWIKKESIIGKIKLTVKIDIKGIENFFSNK